MRPDLLILDEAQRIKNWRTKIASAVKQIGSRYAFVLTGTPLENRLEDLYSLLQVIDPRVLGPLWRYMVDFHITDDRGKVLGYRNLSGLRPTIGAGDAAARPQSSGAISCRSALSLASMCR